MEFLKFDYENVLNQKVGEQGIKIDEIKSYEPKIKLAYEKLIEHKKKGDIGFLALPYKDTRVKEIKKFVEKNLRYKYDNFLVIGIGGSILGNITLFNALKPIEWNFLTRKQRKGYLRFFGADNVDPHLIGSLLNLLNIEKTVINVISKSGTTTESLANFFIFLKKIKKKYTNIIFITDPETGFLLEFAKKYNIKTFYLEKEVTGRFSTLSVVGLLSSQAVGIDIEKLLDGAKWMDKNSDTPDLFKNPPALYAVIQYIFYTKGKRIHVLMPYSSQLYYLADWFRQLWAESLGKKYSRDNEIINVGPTPIKALGVIDQHSQLQLYIEGPYDKTITFISVEKFNKEIKIPQVENHYLSGHTLNELIKAEELGTKYSLTKEKRPNMTLTIPEISPQTVGALLFFFELSTYYMAELLNINAFDQPGVELGKNITYALLGRKGYEKYLPEEIEAEKKIESKSTD